VEVTRILSQRSHRLFRVEIVSKTDYLPEYSTITGFVTIIRIEPDGLYISGYIADRQQVEKLETFAHDRDIEFEVVRISDEAVQPSESALTDEQLAAVITAFEMGYFEVPKDATQEAVAEELGITTTSLSERLTRAQQRLVEQHLVGPNTAYSRLEQ